MLRIILFVAAFLAFAAAAAPLSAVMGIAEQGGFGLTYSSTSGTIWRGVARGVVISEQDLGDVDLAIQPMALVRGRLQYTVTMSGGALTGTGEIAASPPARLRLSNLNGAAQISKIGRVHPVVKNRDGSVALTIAELVATPKGCRVARGEVRTDILTKDDPRMSWTGPNLAGPLGCEDGALTFALTGADNSADINARAKVGFDGAAEVSVDVQSVDPRLVNALNLIGFRQDGAVFRYQRSFSGR